MAFRHRKFAALRYESKPIVVLKDKTIEEDGITKVVQEEVCISDPEYANTIMPDAKDYTLQNLLAAGIELQDMSVSGLLSKTDRATASLEVEDILTKTENK